MNASELLERYGQARELLAKVETSPTIQNYREMLTNIRILEEQVKEAVKTDNQLRVACGNYEAVLVIRHAAPTILYKVPEIERESWGSACITKAVDEKVFVAVCMAKSIDMDLFRTVTEGRETKAVSVREIAAEKVTP